MSGQLNHSPANILSRVLIALGQGVDPPDPGVAATWPIYYANEPPSPDNCITVYDTAGLKMGRHQIDGEVQERHGIQVRVRSKDHDVGYLKARAIAQALDTEVYQELTTIDSDSYITHSFSRSGDVVPLGKEVAASKRSLFTVNGTVSVRMI